MSIFKTFARRTGRAAIWAAAYIVVLNMWLSSMLLAAIHPVTYNALHQICFNGGAAAQDLQPGDTTTGKLPIKCPLCQLLTSGAAAPPPDVVIAVARIAYVIAPSFERPALAAKPSPDPIHQPRGPPHDV